MESQISCVEDFRLLVAKVLGPKKSQLRRRRNAAVPIHQLPPELFTHSLLLTLDVKMSWSVRNLHNLAQVSSFWAATVKSSPLFWQHLSSKDPKIMHGHVLRINKTGTLHVVCQSGSNQNKPHFRAALPHASRWQSLLFGGHPDDLLDDFSVSTPNLKDLYLYNSKIEDGVSSPTLVLGEGRHLLTLDLEGFNLFWDSDRLTGLEAISLRILRGSLPSVMQLHAMLASSPRLWLLILQNLRPDSSVNMSKPHHCHTITLPKLSKLLLSDIPLEMSEYVFSTIVVSQPLRLDVDNVSASSADSLISSALRYILPAASLIKLQFDSGVGSLLIQTQPHPALPDDWVYRIKDKTGCSISFDLRSEWPTLGTWLANIDLPPTKLIITIDKEPWDPNHDFPLELFRAPLARLAGAWTPLRSITHLEVPFGARRAGGLDLPALERINGSQQKC